MLYLDTCLLVALFIPEPDSVAVRIWFDTQVDQTLAISDWTLTEFASAMGIKVRSKSLKPDFARRAGGLMQSLAADSLQVFTPARADYAAASEYLGRHVLGLRAGDALHLAIARNQGADGLCTLDRGFIKAGRRLGFRLTCPI